MRRALAIALGLAAVATLTAAGRFERFTSRTPQGRSDRGFIDVSSGTARAYFEFAPADGAGMGSACAGTVPTGAKGEVMSFTRASTATCLKGSTTSAANGDMVLLSANQPRIGPGGDGSGALKYLVESGRTNIALRSQELNNGAWLLSNSGASNPVVTADQAVAPYGTTTAERIDYPAVSGAGKFSVVYQGIAGSVAAYSGSLWVRGVSSSGTIYIMSTPNGATFLRGTCAYYPGAWTPCSYTGTEDPSTWYLQIGVDRRDASQSDQPAQSVYVWRVQHELGPYPSSYIATAGSSASRAADQLTGGSSAGLGSTGCASATIIPEWTDPSGPAESIVSGGSAGRYLYTRALTASLTMYDGATVIGLNGGFSAGSPKRVASNWTASTQTIQNVTDATSATGAFDGTMATGTLEIGYSSWGTTGLGAWIGNIKLDPTTTGCQ